jgi:hypothetical protein
MPAASALGDAGELAAAAAPLLSDGTNLYLVYEAAGGGGRRREGTRWLCEMYDPSQGYCAVRRIELLSPTAPIAHTNACNGCGRVGFPGERLHCGSCTEFYLCKECAEAGLWQMPSHTIDHATDRATDPVPKRSGDLTPLSATSLARGALFTTSHMLCVCLPQGAGALPPKRAVCRVFDLRDGVGTMLGDFALTSWNQGMVLSPSPSHPSYSPVMQATRRVSM